jgi:hypothetical protein
MSQVSSPTAPSNFQLSFSHALHEYKKQNREDLLLHPLAATLQACDSSDAILSVLEEQTRALDQPRNGDERLRWLGSIVNVLYPLSRSLEEGIGLVIIQVYWFKKATLPFIF